MRMGSLITLVATVLPLSLASASDVRILSLPNTVVGIWAPDANACSAGDAKLDIAATQHSTAVASCKIAWITVTASREGPVYSARSVCTLNKTGQQEPPSYLLVTPQSDDTLLVRRPDASSEGDRMTYQKCS